MNKNKMQVQTFYSQQQSKQEDRMVKSNTFIINQKTKKAFCLLLFKFISIELENANNVKVNMIQQYSQCLLTHRIFVVVFVILFLIQVMNKSKQIQEEYSNLKLKVEGRIKELQSKLIPHPSPNRNRSPLLQFPNTHNHHCHHHCHNHCNSPQILSPNQLSLSRIEPAVSEMQSLKQIGVKNNSVNQLISEALVQSLRSQKQINQQIRQINEKIETLSAQPNNRSNLSEVFSESVRKPKKILIKGENFLSEEKIRCRSQLKQQQIDPNKTDAKRYEIPKKIKSKKVSNVSSPKLFQVSSKKSQIKSKSNKKIVSEYFLSFGACPMHSPNKISLKSVRSKQIYKDSEHRNRKHQKSHLLESFKQQQRSRKRLISKIAQNAFNEYGNK